MWAVGVGVLMQMLSVMGFLLPFGSSTCSSISKNNNSAIDKKKQ